MNVPLENLVVVSQKGHSFLLACSWFQSIVQTVGDGEELDERNGGTEEAQEDRDGGHGAAGESSGEDSELYAGEPTPKQYGQPDHGM